MIQLQRLLALFLFLDESRRFGLEFNAFQY